jgi:hypothetical protein
MRKTGSIYSREFNVNLLLSKYEDELVKSEAWDISIELSCPDVLTLSLVNVQGLSIEDWITSLFSQKLLSMKDEPFLNNFKNVVFVNQLDDSYIISIIELILKPNISESISIQSIELKNNKNVG